MFDRLLLLIYFHLEIDVHQTTQPTECLSVPTVLWLVLFTAYRRKDTREHNSQNDCNRSINPKAMKFSYFPMRSSLPTMRKATLDSITTIKTTTRTTTAVPWSGLIDIQAEKNPAESHGCDKHRWRWRSDASGIAGGGLGNQSTSRSVGLEYANDVEERVPAVIPSSEAECYIWIANLYFRFG